jgi:hypothetical protein
VNNPFTLSGIALDINSGGIARMRIPIAQLFSTNVGLTREIEWEG